jgi:transcriptional regulator with XRE-family HTH domain
MNSQIDTLKGELPSGTEGGVRMPQPALGKRLKALRMSRGLSLKEVAAETGVSASFLSMIEMGRNEMTVGRLLLMANFYEVRLDDLVGEREMEPPVVLRQDDRRAIDSDNPRVRTEPLASWHRGDVTSTSSRFDAGAELSEADSQAGPEFVLVLAGELTIEFDDETSLLLREGDSTWFEASRRHRRVNTGDREAHVIFFKGAMRPGQV